MYIATF